MNLWRPALWLLYRLPPQKRAALVYDADEFMPGWLYDRYEGFGSRLTTAYNRDRMARSKGCSVCGEPLPGRLAVRLPEGGIMLRCENGHEHRPTVLPDA